MPSNIDLQDQNIINLMLTQWGNFCNICGAKRTLDNIKIVRRTAEAVILHISCASCQNGHFITFNYNSAGFTMQQYSSDLRDSELHKLDSDRVDVDDLLDTHIALQDVNTSKDLLALISRKDKSYI